MVDLEMSSQRLQLVEKGAANKAILKLISCHCRTMECESQKVGNFEIVNILVNALRLMEGKLTGAISATRLGA
jgi:hypothetical protein